MKKESKKFTIQKLINKSYYEKDEEKYLDYIWELRTRGNKEVFYQAKHLIYSKDDIYRKIGADILAQFGYKTKLYRGENIYLLAKLLDDKNESVVASAIYGLGHKHSVRYADKLASFTKSSSLEIKRALAFALGGFEKPKAIKALIELMNDNDFDVRNWATFSLGSICESNTSQIRQALHHKLTDCEPEIHGEAMIGLALRKDERVKEAIIKDLQQEFYGSWIFESIVEMPDIRYKNYFQNYIENLEQEDKKAFQIDIQNAKKALIVSIKKNFISGLN